MLIVIVDFTVAAENHNLALATLHAEAPVVRALAGNEGFSVWTSPDQGGTFRLMHEWSDADAFAAYRASEGFKTAGGILFPLMLGKPTSRVFDASLAAG
jgi:quinol monooxygenase YgiN